MPSDNGNLAYYSKAKLFFVIVGSLSLAILPSIFYNEHGRMSIFNHFPLSILFIIGRLFFALCAALLIPDFIRSVLDIPAVSISGMILKYNTRLYGKLVQINDLKSFNIVGDNLVFIMDSGYEVAILGGALKNKDDALVRIRDEVSANLGIKAGGSGVPGPKY